MSANIFTDTDNRIIVFSDDVNDETIGKLSLELLSFISKDDKDENEKKILLVLQFIYILIQVVAKFMICGH